MIKWLLLLGRGKLLKTEHSGRIRVKLNRDRSDGGIRQRRKKRMWRIRGRKKQD